jgi:hypothetical protein
MERGGTLRISIRERGGRAQLAVAGSAAAVPAIHADPDAPRVAAAAALAESVNGRVEVEDEAGVALLVLSLPVAGA